jgi:hypothetical protein
MNNNQQASQIIKDLQLALDNDKKQEIHNILNRAELVEWNDVHESTFEKYIAFLDEAKIILNQ